MKTLETCRRLDWDLNLRSTKKFEEFYHQRNRRVIPTSAFNASNIWLEIGAGTGAFFIHLARTMPDTTFVAIERSRMRGKRLLHRAARAGLSNLLAVRGNAIAALIAETPCESIDRIFILYPCPWPRTSQRRNRWYLHPIMAHLVRSLKKEGALIWASDQEFYITEAQYVCKTKYQMNTLACGELAPNNFNEMERFPLGRTKFEISFLASGMPCYELIAQK